MKTVLKLRWLMPVLWVAAVVALVLTAPNMEQLVRDKGQIGVPDGYSSSIAAKLIRDRNGSESKGSGELSAVLVFHHAKGLTADDQAEIRHAVEELKTGKDKTGVTSVTSPYDSKELEGQMLAKDGQTALVLVNVAPNGRTPAETRDALYAAVDDIHLEHEYTGSWLIDEDVVASSQEGLKKTEWITVVFILTILFVVFRSVVAPFIPLLTVGLSYVAAQSVVAMLVDTVNFPLSNFTQIFMVAVMFGIGTDYCILLISRFKEELAHRGDKAAAIIATYRSAGKTVLVSGLAVLVGFSSIGFSTFGLYRSAVAVAVGVAVLLLALVTLVPFFMAVLGRAIFWPARGSLEHKPSGLWGAVGRFSLKRPLLALAILAIVIVPFLSVYKGSLSFNSLEELGPKYKSVKAFQAISDSFGPGDSLPSTVVLKSDKPMDTPEGLGALESVARELAKVDGVKTVRGATRPVGQPIGDLQVASQVGSLDNGLGQSRDGLGQIGKGLSDAKSALAANGPQLKQAEAGAVQLTDGTKALKDGVVQLGDGLERIRQGIVSGSDGAGDLSAGLQQAKDSADQLASASQQLLGHYRELEDGLGKLQAAYGEVATQAAGLAQGLNGVGQSLSSLAKKHPELANDADFLQAQGAVNQLQDGAAKLSDGLAQLNAQLAPIVKGLSQANDGYAKAADGQAALTQGLAQLADGIARLQAGLEQAADGQGQIVAKVPGLTSGIDQLQAGQKQLADGFTQLGSQLGQLTDGLGQSADGISKVSDGLKSAQSYLQNLAGAPDKDMTGFYVPEDAIRSADFQKALDVYMSKDRKTATFDVVFNGNPYDSSTLPKADDLQAAVDRAIKGTPLEGSIHAVDGVTSIYNDLHHISSKDYSRTVLLMIIGIALILIILFRSLVIPIYLILSLLLTYYTSMAITEVIFVRLLGHSGISWAVPFFGFVLLMALGIDYSIFLMDRFKEYRRLSPSQAILEAMRNMGTVIMSAALILGGTFAAMLPSGVMSLLEIATIVLSGLTLYALVMLPLFIPVMVRMFGAANWWPFLRQEGAEPAETLPGVKAQQRKPAGAESVTTTV